MALRFSHNGPEIPSELVDSILTGEAVFLCGTGVSSQLPDFRRLVRCTYKTLGVKRTASEKHAFKDKRFEEVLGSLSQRLADPHAVTRTVSDLLQLSENPCVDQHHIILRLSRDMNSRISVVTTNFDTLLERAATEVEGNRTPLDISFAGQALPAPGSPSFSGIVHIHGRRADSQLGLQQSQLVLTSADYGDAYMRSGWASRFLFDLARCKVIVLVGYSAYDAPVRYFLSVLRADRARFRDLKPVYAFSAYKSKRDDADLDWDTLAVRTMPYCKVNPDTGEMDHLPLWRDLAALAEIVERPKKLRRERAGTILRRPATELDDVRLRELAWLFGGRRNLWSTALNAIADPEWFKVLVGKELWSVEDAAWLIPSWIAKDFKDLGRFECALEWQQTLGRKFTERIERRLAQTEGLDEIWTRIWRVFCLVVPDQQDDQDHYLTKNRLASGVVLDSDLRNAVSLLAPRLVLRRSPRDPNEESDRQTIRRLGDIVRPSMSRSKRRLAEELVNSLCAISDRHLRILELATAELRSALELEVELELISQEYDPNDSSVPSIESHAQNQYAGGVNPLVRVLVESLVQAGTSDPEATRNVVLGWKSFPGRIGLRLCLHAMRNDRLFEPDEAMLTLLSVSNEEFWSIRRELALLLKEQVGRASPALIDRIEQRIRESSDAYYDRYPIEPGGWRGHARDAAVWLRLNMLLDAGVLSALGAKELSAIKQRRDYLNREVEERDSFGAYVTPPYLIAGDPAPIVEAAKDDRLRVARDLARSTDFDFQEGWSAFCASDPEGAFDSLFTGDLTPENGVLWDQFLLGMAFGEKQTKTVRNLSVQALEYLERADAETLGPMVRGLCALILSVPRERVRNVEGWLVKLWETISNQPEESLEIGSDLLETALGSSAGKLSQTVLLEVEARKKAGCDPTDEQLRLIKSIADHQGPAGRLGRAVLVRNLVFLLYVDREFAVETLWPSLNAEDVEGAALRAVVLERVSITPEITQLFGRAIMTGVIDSVCTDNDAAIVASKILPPMLAYLRGDNTVEWGLTAADVAQVLRRASPAIRGGALDAMERCLRNDPAGVEEAWSQTGVPFFERLWPKESEFIDVSLTPYFVALSVGSGTKFPMVLELLRPYISPYCRYGSLHDVAKSSVPEQFPRETLDLIWIVCGPNSRRSFFQVPEITDRLIEADPDIEVDRRLQWLEHKSERFD